MSVSSLNMRSDLASRLANSASDLAALSVVSTAPQGRAEYDHQHRFQILLCTLGGKGVLGSRHYRMRFGRLLFQPE